MVDVILEIFVLLLLALFVWRILKRSEGARNEAKAFSRPTLEMEKPQDVSVEMLGAPPQVGGAEEDHGQVEEGGNAGMEGHGHNRYHGDYRGE